MSDRANMSGRQLGSGEMSSFSMNPESNSDQMPSFSMDSAPNQSGMYPKGMNDSGGSSSNLQFVLVEMRLPKSQGMAALQLAQNNTPDSFHLDTSYEAIPMSPSQEMAAQLAVDEEVVIVRGQIEENQIPELEAQPNVIKVYPDTPIAPFTSLLMQKEGLTSVSSTPAFGTCPIGTCDCTPGTAKGTITDVAVYLGVDRIWADGYRGEGIVVGVVDGGITAEDRPVIAGETSRRIPRFGAAGRVSVDSA
ncbi:MAG TPA: hypothetical protein DDZ80_17830 [Cyanobacteria bacterium UBA8803]|nr:hypothetical protein [Cyanobacteria bacterium UBA9273]HBL60245.1 hypothetical protein [Cyanobacteria bacterium UBA8803]